MTLQEFTVVCTTCQSRIKVRNPNLVGQIVPCPKCSSMVLIENLNRIVVSPHGDAANSQTETKEALGPLPNLAANSDDRNSEQSPNARQRFRADGNGTPASASSEAASPANSTRSVTKSNSLPQPTASDSGVPLTPLSQADWVSAKARARRQILLVFFLSLSSCIVTVLLFVLFVKSWGETAATPVAQKTDAAAKSPTATDSPATNSTAIPADIAPTTPPAEPTTDEPASPTANNEPNTDTNVTEPASTPPEQSPLTPAIPPVEASTSEAAEPPMTAATDETAAAENTNSPTTVSPTTPTPTTPTTADKPAQLPDSLLKLATVFDPSLETRLGETPGSTIQPGASALDIAALPVLSTAKLHPPAAAKVDVAKKLAEEIAGIEIRERPLAEVLELWCQLSGVGIDIQWNQIAAANVRPLEPVSIRQGRITFGDLLNEIVSKFGLEVSVQENSLVRIAPQEAFIVNLLPKQWNISELLTDKCSATDLTNLILALHPKMTDTFQVSNDEIQWNDGTSAFQKFAVLEVLEHLRIVRGIQLGSTYHRELFERSWPAPDAQPATQVVLAKPAVKNAPIGQTLILAAQEAGSIVSVDWPATWEHGLSPLTEETFLPRGRTLQGLVDAVGTKYGLEVAWLSSNHVLLTNVQRQNQMEMLVHLELPAKLDVESLKRKLSRFSTLSENDLPSIRFAIDPQTDMLLAIIRPLRTDEISQRP
jgi:hypothetical protein